jgi:transposase
MEKREAITLDARAQQRLYVLNHVLAGELTGAEAAAFLRVSVRTVRRLLSRYRGTEGAAALIHGNAGRVPSNRLDDATRTRLVEFATTRYADVNRAHLADLLAEREGFQIPERSLRRILAEAGLPPVRRRRPKGHRSRRERMSQAGLLLQVDGSRHDWLEGRGPWLTLVGAIDDATGVVTGATFRDQEDTAGYFEALIQTARGYGLPVALYSDRHGIFWKNPRQPPTLAEQFAGRRSTTQLGRALETAAIAWVAARSAQAKGRVERLWGTAQDRLLVELRLAGATTREEANIVLADYVIRHNARFGVPPADPAAAWRPLPADRPAEAIFCARHVRTVARDGTFTLTGQSLMIVGRNGLRGAGRRLEIQERLDGSRWVEIEGTLLPVIPAPERPIVLRRTFAPTEPRPGPAVVAGGNHDPNHPWRRYPAVRPR